MKSEQIKEIKFKGWFGDVTGYFPRKIILSILFGKKVTLRIMNPTLKYKIKGDINDKSKNT